MPYIVQSILYIVYCTGYLQISLNGEQYSKGQYYGQNCEQDDDHVHTINYFGIHYVQNIVPKNSNGVQDDDLDTHYDGIMVPINNFGTHYDQNMVLNSQNRPQNDDFDRYSL